LEPQWQRSLRWTNCSPATSDGQYTLRPQEKLISSLPSNEEKSSERQQWPGGQRGRDEKRNRIIKYQRMPRIGKRAIFDGEPLWRCTRGSAEAKPRTHAENIVSRGGLPERVQILLDLGMLRNEMANERRTQVSAEAIRAPGCTADAVGPTGLAQTRGAPFAVLRMSGYE